MLKQTGKDSSSIILDNESRRAFSPDVVMNAAANQDAPPESSRNSVTLPRAGTSQKTDSISIKSPLGK